MGFLVHQVLLELLLDPKRTIGGLGWKSPRGKVQPLVQVWGHVVEGDENVAKRRFGEALDESSQLSPHGAARFQAHTKVVYVGSHGKFRPIVRQVRFELLGSLGGGAWC
jgi:hypothetical protein